MSNITIELNNPSTSVEVNGTSVKVSTPSGVVILELGPETVFCSKNHTFGGQPVRLPLGNDAQELAAALRCRQPKRCETRSGAYRKRLIEMRKSRPSQKPTEEKSTGGFPGAFAALGE